MPWNFVTDRRLEIARKYSMVFIWSSLPPNTLQKPWFCEGSRRLTGCDGGHRRGHLFVFFPLLAMETTSDAGTQCRICSDADRAYCGNTADYNPSAKAFGEVSWILDFVKAYTVNEYSHTIQILDLSVVYLLIVNVRKFRMPYFPSCSKRASGKGAQDCSESNCSCLNSQVLNR